jgi:mannose-6-phosphate isomerase-like protein (cupin superfamily)
MKNRRKFFRATIYGLLGSAMISFPKLTFANNSNKKGIVKNIEEGETYLVRENTPITIYISNKGDNADSISICTEEVLPGNSIPLHKHLNEDEMFFFNKGSGTFLLNEEEIQISGGSTAFVPKGTWHGLRNTGTELLVFTFGYSPTGFEDFFRQIGTLKGKPFKAKTPEEFKQLAQKYGIVYK